MALQVGYVRTTNRDELSISVLDCIIGAADIVQQLPTIEYHSNNIDNEEIRIYTNNDQIAFEYDDRVRLVFTPDNSILIAGVEDLGEYIRDFAIVNIIDNDSKRFYNYEQKKMN